jgi:hypothetical protein
VVDPTTQRMTFVGTDGKDKSYLITIQNEKVVSAVVLPYHLADLPGGLIYCDM